MPALCQFRACTVGQLPAKLYFGAAPVVSRAYASTMPVPRLYWKPFCETGAVPSRLWISTWAQVKKSDSCQYLQKTQYRASCKQGAISVLDTWYRAEGWRGTGIVQTQSWDQVSANNRLQINASTEPVQISDVQYHASTFRQLPAKLYFGAVPVVGRAYASTMPVPCQYCKSFCGTGAVPSRL